ncbi:MAG: FtsX-like permease family protein [Dehalococcoidia bacterium]|nr:FtsX-like permease family protein [Dehalococcoidia bacterium]
MEKLFGVEMNVLAISLSSLMVITLVAAIILASRNRILVKLALRNIPRRKAQTVLIIVGLMLSTTIIMAALGIGDSINGGIRLGALYSLGGTDIRLTSQVSSRFGDNYLDDSVVDRVRSELDGDQRIDGIMPLVREQMPVVNEESKKTLASAVVVGAKLDSITGFDGLIGTEEEGRTKVDLAAMQDGEVIINRPMADELDLGIGDFLTLISPIGRSEHTVLDIVDPVGILGGTESTRSSAMFPDKSLQRLLGRDGYNMIEVSVTGKEIVEFVTHDEKTSKDVTKKLKLAFTNNDASETLFEVLKTPSIKDALERELAEQESTARGSDTDNPLFDLVKGLGENSPSEEFKIAATDGGTQAIIFEVAEASGEPALTASVFKSLGGLVEIRVDPIKNRSLQFAEAISSGIVVFFTIFGSFSIIVGLLLIFLVFVMLAASRTTEMGIARAIGTKRRHLVQMFTYEGLVYSLGASIVGTGLGILASMLLIQMMIRAFADSDDVTFFYSVTFRSIVVAFSAGFVLTALTVTISAYRVSKLNIVVAIRGLSQEFVSDEVPSTLQRAKTVLKWVFGPLTFAVDTWRLWRDGYGVISRVFIFFSLLLIVPWIVVLISKVFKFFQPWLASGWPLLPVGLILAFAGLDPEKGVDNFAYDSAALVAVGVTLSIVSIGLMVRRILAYRGYREEFQKRVSMSLIGLAMLTFYSLPFDALENITGELEGGPEMFILSGVSLVAASVWVVMHNADVLVWIISRITGQWGSLRPVVKTAIAYPMSARLRTGLTLAMFSLVIFTMMIFAILINLGNVIRDDPDKASGGFDIRGVIKPELPIDDPYAVIDGNGNDLSVSDFELITSQAKLRVEVRQADGELIFKRARIRASDEVWLRNNLFQFTHWDPAYGQTSQEIWQSVANDPGLAVVAAGIIREEDGWGPPRGDSVFQLTGIEPDEKGEISGVDITLRPPVGQGASDRLVTRKVVGVLDEFADYFENNQGSSNDIYMHYSVLEELSEKTVPFTDYKFRITDPSRADELTRLLETVFIDHGMTAKSTLESIDQEQAQTNAFNQLFQGFMGLGLLVGVAALGVIAFRAVVERRQSIGMMRAIGYKARMVQLQFLMESGVVAVLGSLLGIGLGTLMAWNIYKSISQESAGVTFSIPIVNVAAIVLVAVVFSLLNTMLPARQASGIKPAEALRYE